MNKGISPNAYLVKTPEPLGDAAFIDMCDLIAMRGQLLTFDEIGRLFKLAGYQQSTPDTRLAFPPLVTMLDRARKLVAL